MRLLTLILPGIAAALLATALTPVAAALGRRIGALDPPGHRKVHLHTVPRTGGAAVVVAVVSVLAVVRLARWELMPALPDGLMLGLVLGVLPVFAVSLYDDIWPIGPLPRFGAQIIGASIAIAFGITLGDAIHLFGKTIYLNGLAIPLTILWIVCITNAFNIVDGLDGLSAGLALVSAGSVAALALFSANASLALLSLILVGALLGFLPYNIYPARIFLGDCGATSVGFLLACLALPGGATLPTSIAIVVPLLAMGVPLAETSVSIMRRWLRRGFAGLFEADAEHIHHRLLRLGFDQPRAVLVLCGASLIAAATGIGSLLVTDANAALLLATLFAAAFIGVGRLGYDEFAVIRRGVVLKFYDSPVLQLGFFRVFVDLAIAATAFYSAIVLKYDDWGIYEHRKLVLNTLALILPVALFVFSTSRLYKRSWRFASVADVVDSALASAVTGAGAFILTRIVVDENASATLFATFTLLFVLSVCAARSSFRVLQYFRERARSHGMRIAIYGAGSCGMLALREIQRNAALNFDVVGFIDDDPAKAGRRIAGYPVLGGISTIGASATRYKLSGLVIATAKIQDSEVRDTLRTSSKPDLELFQFSITLRSVGDDARARELAV